MSNYYLSDGVHGNSRIMQENNSDPYANENSEAPNFSVSNKFCIETQLWYGGGCNKAITSTSCKLQCEKDGSTVWEDLGTADVAAYDCTGLTEGNPQGSSHCTDPAAGECANGFESGVQCTDGAISKAITSEYYSCVVWGCDPANCAAGSSYRFRVYDVTSAAPVPGSVSAYITIASAVFQPEPSFLNMMRRNA